MRHILIFLMMLPIISFGQSNDYVVLVNGDTLRSGDSIVVNAFNDVNGAEYVAIDSKNPLNLDGDDRTIRRKIDELRNAFNDLAGKKYKMDSVYYDSVANLNCAKFTYINPSLVYFSNLVFVTHMDRALGNKEITLLR